ncbi:Nucleolar complex protein 3 [Histomonas meleagridis]|uniref:Nucleolar complex protein 3 n=1 Tax=Histomonas meleagridis TaxID=135588 RepID=UPI003559EB01|nr:Nucleolar complex protein 3 [Histomonas meleagridis]KAH0806179.1 Nucleolar complex protein 3 [Histomonas meleagridis]
MEAYDEIADLSTSLIQKQSFQTKENLDKLFSFCKNKNRDVAKAAILSVMQVLIDILPSYPVGKHGANENLSKEVRARRFQEETLLNFARKFIQFCEGTINNRKGSKRLQIASGKALASLLQAKPGFNTAEHLSKVIVRLANNKEKPIRDFACEKIAEIFRDDSNGSKTLKVMNQIALTPTNQISTELLQALLSIKFKKDEPQPKSEEKPKKKYDKDLERELREADVIDNKTEQQKNQISILEHLFGTVFRFLKETKSEQHFLDAMHVVRRYVDYINIDIVPSIIDALKKKRFSLLASITAAQTAISVCNTAQYSVDLRDFYTSVYERAYEALDDRDALLQLLALFEIISEAINKSRTASFAKRLMIMTLHASHDVASVVLCHIRQMFTNDASFTSAVDFQFEAENEFNISLDDPDFCNGTSAKYWELSELCQSSSDFLRTVANEIATLTDLNAIRESDIRAANEKRDWRPRNVLEKYDNTYRIFDAMSIMPQNHVLPKQFKIYNFE